MAIWSWEETMKNSNDRILEILKTEYNIASEKDLDKKIKKLGYVDISVFCKKPAKKVKAT